VKLKKMPTMTGMVWNAAKAMTAGQTIQ